MPSFQLRRTLASKVFFEPQLRLTAPRIKFKGKAKKSDPMLLELPAVLTLLASSIRNGSSTLGALEHLGRFTNSKFCSDLAKLNRRINLGESLESALEQLQRENKSPAVAEFCNRLSAAIVRGTPIATQLQNLAASTRSQLALQLLERAGRNEIKMLLPLVFLILPVTIWFAIFPSLQYLQLGI